MFFFSLQNSTFDSLDLNFETFENGVLRINFKVLNSQNWGNNVILARKK